MATSLRIENRSYDPPIFGALRKKQREGSARPFLSTAYGYIVPDRVRAQSLWRCSIGQQLTEALRERSSKSRLLGSLNLEQPAQSSHDESRGNHEMNDCIHERFGNARAHAQETRTLLET
jgi:hypothetical protein